MNISRQINLLCMHSDLGIDLVKNILNAIVKWNNVVRKELSNQQSNLEKKEASENELEDMMETIGEEKYTIDETKRVMYATISVSLFAVMENFLRELCDIMGINKRNKPNWRDFRRLIEKVCNIQFNKIPSFENVNRIRLLNNCFKHSNGTVSKEFAKKFNLNEGDIIKYELEDWDRLIKDCKSFMSSIAEKKQKSL